MRATNKMRAATALLSVALLFLLQGCVVGPKYNRPPMQAPGTYKEVTPDDLKKMDGWKVAQPQDSALHGKWWEIFGDAQLNALEEQVNISNQNVAAAFANFMAARALVREAGPIFPKRLPSAPASFAKQQPAAAPGRAAGPPPTNFSYRLTLPGRPTCLAACATWFAPASRTLKPAPPTWRIPA